jgi:hypothetical protein
MGVDIVWSRAYSRMPIFGVNVRSFSAGVGVDCVMILRVVSLLQLLLHHCGMLW